MGSLVVLPLRLLAVCDGEYLENFTRMELQISHISKYESIFSIFEMIYSSNRILFHETEVC